jgi:hypothetical protein
MDKLIFVSKKWPNDPSISCKSFSSLANFIESDFNLFFKLEEFERTFKRDEVVELWILKFSSPNFHVFLSNFLTEKNYFK